MDFLDGLRTPAPIVLYALYLRYLGQSFRRIAKALAPSMSGSHVAVYGWVGRLKGFRNAFASRCRVSLFLIDDAEVKVDGGSAWILIAYEPFEKKVLGMWLSWTRNQLQVEMFLKGLIEGFGRHPVYTDGGPH